MKSMKNKKSTTPTKLWYVASKEDLDALLSKGITNYCCKSKFIHSLSFKLDYTEFSSPDYLAFNVMDDNLEYLLVELDVSMLNCKIRNCNTEGLAISRSACYIDKYQIPASCILGYSVNRINLEKLIEANTQSIWIAMNKESIPIKEAKSAYTASQYIAHNNRMITDRREAWHYSMKLFRFMLDRMQPKQDFSEDRDSLLLKIKHVNELQDLTI
jgi:hypothetical protein